jgi:hypothetical protein
MSGGLVRSRLGVGIVSSMAPIRASIFTRWFAEIGTTGAPAIGESFKKATISS